MVNGWVMFAGVVCSVETAFCPKESKEALSFPAFKPLKSHVVGFRCFGGHGAHGEAMSCIVVCRDRRGLMLGMTHFFEGYFVGEGSFASVI